MPIAVGAIVPAAGRQTSCSWDIGGPAPDGFWIFPGGQRLLTTLVFGPSGALLVLVALVAVSRNFGVDYFIDGRRKRPAADEIIPVEPDRGAMGTGGHQQVRQ